LLDSFLDLFFLDQLLFYLPLLVLNLFPDYLFIVLVEVLFNVVFNENQSYHKVIPCVVLVFIFFHKVTHVVVLEVILHQFVITLAIVLITDDFIHSSISLRFHE
jgi:hypothetical protein